MDTQGNEQISFEFAFNNPHFSERTFRIEITDEKLVDNQINYITTRLKKRKINKKQVLEADEDEVEKKVLSMHVNSALLAVKSPFFYKLFSNGMHDSNNKYETTLKLKASEETPFKELLHFMYCGKFSSTDISNHRSLLDILILADKYEVMQCMKYCVLLLLKLPMTQESALLYLDLPSSVSTNMEVQQLMDASKKHLVVGFNDREAPRDELVNLSMAGLEVILSSDDILPNSEDEICDFLIDWARHNYLKLMERRVALSSLLIRFVRFPYLSCTCMRELLVCKDVDKNSGSLSHSFGVWLYLESPEEISVSYHYAVRKNPSKLFIDVRNENYTFQSPEGYGYNDVFRTPWSTFIAENRRHKKQTLQNSQQSTTDRPITRSVTLVSVSPGRPPNGPRGVGAFRRGPGGARVRVRVWGFFGDSYRMRALAGSVGSSSRKGEGCRSWLRRPIASQEDSGRPGEGRLVPTSRPGWGGYFLVAAPIMTCQTSHL
ncbi:BTB/POZ domain-containing protein [Acorus calamus]|uniref:BTB/POZ domain-containing protein n=1 Tax=Acorus calamus TaxID=4465 RepID=A0AAV9F845_ACOCL|nr:BTB/POZ domain-containing protein [Acorus calamus]